jgi:hypothetical protein
MVGGAWPFVTEKTDAANTPSVLTVYIRDTVQPNFLLSNHGMVPGGGRSNGLTLQAIFLGVFSLGRQLPLCHEIDHYIAGSTPNLKSQHFIRLYMRSDNTRFMASLVLPNVACHLSSGVLPT